MENFFFNLIKQWGLNFLYDLFYLNSHPIREHFLHVFWSRRGVKWNNIIQKLINNLFSMIFLLPGSNLLPQYMGHSHSLTDRKLESSSFTSTESYLVSLQVLWRELPFQCRPYLSFSFSTHFKNPSCHVLPMFKMLPMMALP